VTPSRRRPVVSYLSTTYRVSERRACRVARVPVSTFRYVSMREPRTALRVRIREIAQTRVRYGYRKIRVLLNREGWNVGKKLVYRLYREEGLTLRHRPRKRRRAALHRRERFRPTATNQAWSLDFVADQLADGRRFRALTVLDVYTRESLAIEVGQKLKGEDVVRALNQIRMQRGVPKVLFCDNVLTAEHQEEVRDKISLRSPGERANEFRAKWLPRARVQALDHSDTRSIGDAVVFPVLKTRS